MRYLPYMPSLPNLQSLTHQAIVMRTPFGVAYERFTSATPGTAQHRAWFELRQTTPPGSQTRMHTAMLRLYSPCPPVPSLTQLHVAIRGARGEKPLVAAL